ncbi:MAG: TSUP family transporter [Synergistaceae bacterium]
MGAELISISTPAMIFVCFMVGLAGFVDAAAGGGGTISVPAYMLTGLPAHYALGCNKFSGSCGTTLAVFKFWKNGAIDLKVALIAAISSFLGSAIGTKIALLLSDQTIKTLLIFILPTAAIIMSLKKQFGEENCSSELTKTSTIIFAVLIGFFIGGYDGLFGPGTGTFAIIAFSILMKFDLKTASGNAKILNLASNYASFITFAMAGTVIYKIAIPTAICGIIGNYFGSHFAITKGAKFIRPMMLFVLAMLLIKIVYDLVQGL